YRRHGVHLSTISTGSTTCGRSATIGARRSSEGVVTSRRLVPGGPSPPGAPLRRCPPGGRCAMVAAPRHRLQSVGAALCPASSPGRFGGRSAGGAGKDETVRKRGKKPASRGTLGRRRRPATRRQPVAPPLATTPPASEPPLPSGTPLPPATGA